MTRIPFWKLSGAGNDFVLLRAADLPRRASRPALARMLCDRRSGIGSDGLLVVGNPAPARRIDHFNGDGSAAFCGNGTRCAAWWLSRGRGRRGAFELVSSGISVEALAGPLGARVSMPEPSGLRLGVRVRAGGRTFQVDSIDTGVPHAVVRVAGLDRFPVLEFGPALRRHPAFGRAGTNVDFLERSRGAWRLRTFERGVEGETLACGTGATACALALAAREGLRSPIPLETAGGRLVVRFSRGKDGRFTDVWLEGPARETFKGEVEL